MNYLQQLKKHRLISSCYNIFAHYGSHFSEIFQGFWDFSIWQVMLIGYPAGKLSILQELLTRCLLNPEPSEPNMVDLVTIWWCVKC